MKSAYELAMERLDRDDPGGGSSLSDADKRELAEIENRYQAKEAERRIFLTQRLNEARRTGKGQEGAEIERQIRDETARIREEMEAAKEKVRRRAEG